MPACTWASRQPSSNTTAMKRAPSKLGSAAATAAPRAPTDSGLKNSLRRKGSSATGAAYVLPIEVDQTAVATTLRAVRSKFIVTLTALHLVLSAMPAAAADDDELVAPQADPGASLFPASENEEPRPDLDLVASGFSSPVFVDAPKGDTRLFVVELGGKIEIIENRRRRQLAPGITPDCRLEPAVRRRFQRRRQGRHRQLLPRQRLVVGQQIIGQCVHQAQVGLIAPIALEKGSDVP